MKLIDPSLGKQKEMVFLMEFLIKQLNFPTIQRVNKLKFVSLLGGNNHCPVCCMTPLTCSYVLPDQKSPRLLINNYILLALSSWSIL